MAAVVADVAPLLKSAGFRKRRHAFNRTTEPGLVQVVHVQMGPFEPPGSEGISLSGSLYGRFTINLGVYVPEMVLEEQQKRSGWVNEYNCQLRQRIGLLLTPPADTWWSLDDPAEASDAARHALDSAGLPWLDRLPSRKAILDAYELLGWAAIGMSPRGPVEIAWLVKGEDRERAEAILRDYMQEPFRNPGHWEPLSRWLKAGGFEHLLDEPPTR
ncbi:MAG TPA: DUF4304 domain-containing protein [Gaiellaceae bacterium]